MPHQFDNFYQRTPSVRMRRTSYGGAAFLPERVATVELDEEAFALLCWMDIPLSSSQLRQRFVGRFAHNVTLATVDRVVRQLKELGFVGQSRDGAIRQTVSNLSGLTSKQKEAVVIAGLERKYQYRELDHENEADRSDASSCFSYQRSSTYLKPLLVHFAPESVHLQLNNVCNLRCPSCYLSLQPRDDGASLPLERLLTLVDEMADLGVFQLALGGGEPLMSPHFVAIVQYARRRGLLPNVTTNGHLLTEHLVTQIRGAIGEVRLSFNDGESVNQRLLKDRAALLNTWGVRFGFNVIVTRRNLGRLEDILRELVALRPYSITLIRPKPAPHNERWYSANALTSDDSALLVHLLSRLEPLFADTLLTVDCAFSYLFYNMTSAELALRGVEGCAMGERFVVVAWNGDVYPCSHIRGAEFRMGNVREQTFQAIYETTRSVFTGDHAEVRRLEGHCGRCAKKQSCGGCRAIMLQTTGNVCEADSGCPFGV